MFETIVQHLKDIKGPRFYFITTLIFFLTVGYLFNKPITDYMNIQRFAQLEFRECRDLIGLEDALNGIVRKNPVLNKYGVYLYQPKENSSYKRMIITSSEIAKRSSSLRGIYLKDQPSINEALHSQPFYLIDDIEMGKHPDLKYIKDLNIPCAIFYKLEVNGKIIGEISFSLHGKPTASELDSIIRELSPLLQLYII